MPLASTILVFASMGCLGLSMALVYVTGPRLGAFLKRQAPPVDVPDFDFYAPLKMNRLVWLILTVRLPTDRPSLRTLLIATRLCYCAAPLLMVSAMILVSQGSSSPLRNGELGPATYTPEIPAEPGR